MITLAKVPMVMLSFIVLTHSNEKTNRSDMRPFIVCMALLAVNASAFSIDSSRGAKIVVVKPNGGQTISPRATYTICWTAEEVDTVRIEYSPDGGSTWLLLSDAVPAISGENFHCRATTRKGISVRI